MSSQMKKRYESLLVYLGRDTKGIELLKLYKDEVNVLRKKLAATETALQAETTVKQQARERADSAEAELAELILEEHRLQQQVANLMREMSIATKPDEPTPVADAVVLTQSDKEALMLPVIKALRKELKTCPFPISRRYDACTLDTYNRYDIAAGWSHKDLWVLGASVAILAEMQATVYIYASDRMEVTDMNPHSGIFRHVGDWLCPEDEGYINKFQAMHTLRSAATLSAVKPYQDL